MQSESLNDLEQMALNLGEVESVEEDEGNMSPEQARLISHEARIAFELKIAAKKDGNAYTFPWAEEYLLLREAGFSWRIASYIAWASSPKKGRWPSTQMELASKVLGLTSDRVIGNWRKKNEIIDALIAKLQAAPLMEHRRDVFEALIAVASKPDHRSNPDRRLYLEMTGDYVPHAKIDVNRRGVEDETDLSDAELERIAKLADKKNGN